MPIRTLVFFLAAVVLVVFHFRQQPAPAGEPNDREPDIVLPPTTKAHPAEAPAPVPAPAPSEVQPTLDRVFGKILTVDQATRPAFVAGDFNGDGVTDLAVAVRPRDKDALPTLNAELAPWGLQDATAPTSHVASGPERATVAAGERLLVVVHGFEAEGWRHAEARQCYLVKNALGTDMRLRPLADMPSAVRMKAIRTHVGEVIVQDRGGGPGLIFWTGAAYTWAVLEPEGSAGTGSHAGPR